MYNKIIQQIKMKDHIIIKVFIGIICILSTGKIIRIILNFVTIVGTIIRRVLDLNIC